MAQVFLIGTQALTIFQIIFTTLTNPTKTAAGQLIFSLLMPPVYVAPWFAFRLPFQNCRPSSPGLSGVCLRGISPKVDPDLFSGFSGPAPRTFHNLALFSGDLVPKKNCSFGLWVPNPVVPSSDFDLDLINLSDSSNTHRRQVCGKFLLYSACLSSSCSCSI